MCLFTLWLAAWTAHAQIGGQSSFAFLRIPSHARTAGLGGLNVSSADRDANMLLSNPALLDSGMHNQLAFNFVPYYAGITHSSLAYARCRPAGAGTGRWGAALEYVNYGEISRTDDAGNPLGTFRAGEFALAVAHARTQGSFTLGGSAKLVGSTIETYAAYAALFDVGGVFTHPEYDWKVGLTVKNLGFRLRSYTPGDQPELPFDVQVGTSFKPAFMPVRFSVTARQLQRFDIAYLDPNRQGPLDANGNEIEPRVGFVDKVARHLVVGGELLLSKNVNLRFGYNHLVNRELRLANGSGGAGFSFGAMVRAKAFELAFSRMYYHAAGGQTALTLACALGRVIKKKNAP
ncbi:MAG: type IX secretion system protein PorQ [Ferruginibacter sp.]|nr:type IX secretion system protein PorQ [Cytophagales bacterium]